jgi:putative superfamily III holin-X
MSSGPRVPAEDWSSLAGRVIDDISRIIQAELRIFETNLGLLFSQAIDLALVRLAALSAVIAGGVCLLVALILSLHQWLDWWQSFAISGAVSVIVGFLYGRFAHISLNELPPANRHTGDRPNADAQRAL